MRSFGSLTHLCHSLVSEVYGREFPLSSSLRECPSQCLVDARAGFWGSTHPDVLARVGQDRGRRVLIVKPTHHSPPWLLPVGTPRRNKNGQKPSVAGFTGGSSLCRVPSGEYPSQSLVDGRAGFWVSTHPDVLARVGQDRRMRVLIV